MAALVAVLAHFMNAFWLPIRLLALGMVPNKDQAVGLNAGMLLQAGHCGNLKCRTCHFHTSCLGLLKCLSALGSIGNVHALAVATPETPQVKGTLQTVAANFASSGHVGA